MSEYAAAINPGFGTGNNFMPGTAQVLYFASVNDILTFPKPAASPTPVSKKYTVEDDFVMKVGKQFHKMYRGIETGQIQFEPLGNREGSGFKVSDTAFIPGDSEDMNYFVNESQSDRFIIIEKLPNGSMVLVGTEDFPATMKTGYDSGTVTSDASGHNVNIEAYQPFKLLYTGEVPLTPAV